MVELSTGGRPDLCGGSVRPPVDNSFSLIYKAFRILGIFYLCSSVFNMIEEKIWPRFLFSKMTGCGNDFIIIDNRRKILDADKLGDFVRKVCAHKLSAGADGVVLIEPSQKVNFKWRFFNSDGSVGEMCGNAARCVARFAVFKGIAPQDGLRDPGGDHRG